MNQGGNTLKTLNQNIGQKGAAAVEFAIILPLLVTLVFGIIEFSTLFYNKAMITNASREGARAGIVFANPRMSDEGIRTVVKTYCSNNLITFGDGAGAPLDDDDIDISPPEGSRNAGDSLSVTVRYHYDFLVLPNFISSLLGGLNLSAVTVMRME